MASVMLSVVKCTTRRFTSACLPVMGTIKGGKRFVDLLNHGARPPPIDLFDIASDAVFILSSFLLSLFANRSDEEYSPI